LLDWWREGGQSLPERFVLVAIKAAAAAAAVLARFGFGDTSTIVFVPVVKNCDN
jgi:hypothetical protein